MVVQLLCRPPDQLESKPRVIRVEKIAQRLKYFPFSIFSITSSFIFLLIGI